MIKPTVGRVVLYRPDAQFADDVRHAATVAHVHTDGTVNLAISDSNGVPYNEQRVTLVDVDQSPERGQAEWMEYQKGQAAKAEALEAQLSGTEEHDDVPPPEEPYPWDADEGAALEDAMDEHSKTEQGYAAEVPENYGEVVTEDDLVNEPESTADMEDQVAEAGDAGDLDEEQTAAS